MNNIHRKVHRLSGKHHKSSQEEIDFSSEYLENSATGQKKKLQE
jgi:hypothetical protein